MTNYQATTLRPGLLVGLKTHLYGNVEYFRSTIESAHTDAEGNVRETWQTEKVIADPKELERAKKAQNAAGSAVRKVCTKSAFGLLCLQEQAGELEDAIARARKICDEFNATSKINTIGIYCMIGTIASNDLEAVRSINSEVRDLLDQMAQGLQDKDVAVVRDAANRARALGPMLTPTAEARVRIAIDAARAEARDLQKAAKKGEPVSELSQQMAVRKISETRTAFLDLGDDIAEVAAPQKQGRQLDLVDEVNNAL